MLQQISVYELSEKIIQAHIDFGYSKDSLYRYKRILMEFKEFTGDISFSPDLPASFLTKIFNEQEDGINLKKGTGSKKHLYYVRSMRHLEDYFYFGTLFEVKKNVPAIEWPDSFKSNLDIFYKHYLASGISERMYRRSQYQLKNFVLYLLRINISKFEDVRYEHISTYISSLVGYAPKTLSTEISCLRVFFRYAYLNEFIQIPLHEMLPRTCGIYRTKVPTVWTKDELTQIKNSIDLGNPSGKRDYAIILLIASTGLRSIDVIKMQLSDINWEQKTIHILQSKTKNELILPLADEVGWALIDYIKNARPIVNSETLFLQLSAPFTPLASSSALYSMFTRRIAHAGIQVKNRDRTGMHSLRHSLANTLLQNNVEINTIANILGHSSPDVTLNYLRSSMELLSKCPLEVTSYFE